MKRLIELFENPEPWIVELENRSWYNDPIQDSDGKYHYIYCWVNMDTQWCYVGKHTSWWSDNREGYEGSSGNLHYMYSKKLHEYKCIILSYEDSKSNALLLESMIIDKYMISNYSENGLFNKQVGGFSCSDEWIKAGRLGLLKAYPETNGMPPQAILAANESMKRRYPDTNGAPPNWYLAGNLRMQELYPDTKGLPPRMIELARSPEVRRRAAETFRATCASQDPTGRGDVCYFFHTKKAINNRRITYFFKYVSKYISELINNNDELDLEVYHHKFGNTHFYRMIRIIHDEPSIIEDPRWTPEMSIIFRPILESQIIM